MREGVETRSFLPLRWLEDIISPFRRRRDPKGSSSHKRSHHAQLPSPSGHEEADVTLLTVGGALLGHVLLTVGSLLAAPLLLNQWGIVDTITHIAYLMAIFLKA